MRPRTPSVLLAATLAAVLVLPGGVALAKGPGHPGKAKAGASAASTADRPAGSGVGAAPRRPGARPAAEPRPRAVPFSVVGVVVTADTASVTVAVRAASSSVRSLRGKTVRVPVATGAKVVKNGRRVSPALLAAGDRVSVVGARYADALLARLVAASGRWAARPVKPRPDTVNPSPDTADQKPGSATP